MNRNARRAEDHEQWLEAIGEVELIGGWAQVVLAADFTARVGTSSYQVFATSYDAVPVFVSNRRGTGFEIHAIPTTRTAPSRTRCAWRAIGRRHIKGDRG